MNRLTRIFQSRFFLVALGLAVAFSQLLAVFVLLYKYVLPITVLGWVFYVFVLLYVINRDTTPELKIPWLIILCLMPVVGAFLFMLLVNDNASKKDFEKAAVAREKLKPYMEQTSLLTPGENLDAHAQANYLYRLAGMPCFSETSTKYYRLGEDFYPALLEDLSKAENYIFMEYFIVQEGKMWNSIHSILKKKVEQGVSVYFMYDDFGCMTTLPENYAELLCAERIHCIPSNQFRPVLSHIHNNRDHRKITVIDGKIGYTGGINLADEYINVYEKHGHWKDTAVRLEGMAVRNLVALFLEMWNFQSKEQLDCNMYFPKDAALSESSGLVIPFGAGPKPIYTEQIGKNVYLNMINGAKRYLYITTPYLICDSELMNALCLASEKGVDVKLITPHIPDKKLIFLMTRSNYKKLIGSGVRIYEYTPGFIHAKNFICDDRFAVCGTINLDYRSFVHHFECGVWMYGTEAVMEMKEDFIRTLAVSQKISSQAAELKFRQRLPAEIMKVFSPLL